MEDRPVRTRNWVVAGAGFAGSLGLIVAAEAVSFGRARSVQADITRLVQEAEHSTYVIGDVGHLLSRLQANVLEALTEEDCAVDDVRERLGRIDGSLSQHLAALPELLSTDELRAWRAIEPEILQFRSSLMAALDLVKRGRTREAEAELDVLAGKTRRVFDELRSLQELNQLETHTQLARANRLLQGTRLLELGLAGILVIGISVIALRALRAVRRKESEVAFHMEALERANRDLEAFAGRVAHDLRNVLTPVQFAGHVLKHSADRPDVVLETAARVERVTRAAGELITGLLAFARAGAPRPEAFAWVEKELRAVLEELDPLIKSVGAEITVDADPELAVRCDAPLLHVLLLNLLSNAVKFSAGRPIRRVIVHARCAEGESVLTVEDTGPGIPPSSLQRIFEPFFRVPGVAATGSGIGLATVRRIVDAHGGRVEVTSEVGKGSRFLVAMPVAERTDRKVARLPHERA